MNVCIAGGGICAIIKVILRKEVHFLIRELRKGRIASGKRKEQNVSFVSCCFSRL